MIFDDALLIGIIEIGNGDIKEIDENEHTCVYDPTISAAQTLYTNALYKNFVWTIYEDLSIRPSIYLPTVYPHNRQKTHTHIIACIIKRGSIADGGLST